MWTRRQLKERAKADVSRSYWGLVLMSLIVSVIDGIGNGYNSGSRSSTDNMRRGTLATNNVDWDLFFGVMFVVLVIILIAFLAGVALKALLLNPLRLGATKYYLEAARGEKKAGDIGLIGYAFGGGRYKNIVKTLFLRDLYVFLWSLLFLIPGIVKAYEYAMIPYILAERPELETEEVFDLSRRMMAGEKFNAFILGLSFIGWIFVSIFTLGLLEVFYVGPYIYMTDAELYEVLRVKIGWRNGGQGNYDMQGNYGNGRGYLLMGDINYPQQQLDMDK